MMYTLVMFKRAYEPLEDHINANKVLVIFGPRRVGKTTLLQSFLQNTTLKYKLDSGDNILTQEVLGSQDFNRILAYVEGYELLAIDEAQNIPNIGMGLKIIVDQVPGIRVIVTGSSSFELAGQVGEPLTGRAAHAIGYQDSFLDHAQLPPSDRSTVTGVRRTFESQGPQARPVSTPRPVRVRRDAPATPPPFGGPRAEPGIPSNA